ncbi:methyltransferase [Planobispora rosea]|uniref:Methyltransferase n=1 Tax=Planobispora rosea TaxID=35762 RepID=A0A8J3WDW8_PLARO|nr:methyltransferase domain-containing protein [Planobispora rosea]GGS84300.1 methyltransferase [Planobispora rosea]GIH86374.1 methyltransferase [Planobispora rosea]
MALSPTASHPAPPAPVSPVSRPGDLGAFISAALRRPATIGAIAPTRAPLARLLAQIVPRTRPAVVVELGAGTGVVSDAISQRLVSGSRQVAVEIDPPLAEHLRTSRPHLEVICGDAAQLRALLAERGLQRVDAVVSALPWSLLPRGTQAQILAEVTALLRPDAALSTIAAHPAGLAPSARVFRRLLTEQFDEITVSPTIWRNLPPARVLTARRPNRHASI